MQLLPLHCSHLGQTFRWLLTDEKDPLPCNCTIDDTTTEINFNNQNDEDGSDDFTLSRVLMPTLDQQATATIRTPTNSSRKSVSVSSKKERRVVAALENFNASREVGKSTEMEIIDIMRWMEGSITAGGTADTASKTRELVEDVNRTRTLIRLCEGDLKKLKEKTQTSINKEKNEEKIKAITKKEFNDRRVNWIQWKQ